MNRHGCTLAAEGAQRAASRMVRITEASTSAEGVVCARAPTLDERGKEGGFGVGVT